MDNHTDKIKADHDAMNMSDKFEDEIRYSYHDLSDKMPQPPSNAFSRIMDNINADEKRQKNSITQSVFFRVFEFINNRIFTQKIGWAAAGVQFAVIMFLFFSPPASDMNNFQTLSINTAPGKSIEINIVFKENAMQKDIKQLLNSSGAIIVNGPTENGLYILKVKQGHDLALRLQAIENSKIVKFAGARY